MTSDFDSLVAAERKEAEAARTFYEHRELLQKGLNEVLRQENIRPMNHRFLQNEDHIATWVDEDNQTVWLCIEYDYEQETWFALNTNNFTGTGYPIVWCEGCPPWGMYRPGKRDAETEEEISGLSVL